MGWNSIVYDQDPIGWCSGMSVQIDLSRVWSTQNCFRIVRHGNSEDIDVQLPEVEDDGEEKHRSETSIAKFWRQTWEIWNNCSGQESQGIKWCWKRKRYLLPVERKGDSVREETNAVSGTRAKPTPEAAPFSEPPTRRGRSASRKRCVRGRSQCGTSNRPPCENFLKGTCTILPCDYWHPPESQFYKSESGCKFSTECSFPHWKVEEQPNKKPKKCGDKTAGGYCEKCTSGWVAYHRTSSNQNPQRFYGRTQKSWDQFDVYGSQDLCCVSQTSEKINVRRSETYKSNFIISAVLTLWNLRIGLRRRLKDRSDAPAETRGDWPRTSLSSKNRTTLPSSHLPMSGVYQPHP